MCDSEIISQLEANGHARRLGGVENYFAILQRQKIYKNFVIKARFNIPLNNELLFKALKAIIFKYPSLAATIVKSDYSDLSKPKPIHDYVKVLNKLQLKDVLVDLSEFKDLCDEDLFPRLNDIVWEYENESVFWRIGYLNETTLVFISNHMMSDGISGKNLIEDLEKEFNGIELQEEGKDFLDEYILTYASDCKFLPPLPATIEKIVDYTPPWSFAIEYIWNDIIFKLTTFVSKVSSRSDSHTYRTFNLSNDQQSNLKHYLKTEIDSSVTLSPYFATAWLEAVSEVLLKGTWFQTTTLSVPCNTRQYIPSSIDADPYRYGANTSGFHKYFFPVRDLASSTIKKMSDYFKYLFESHKFLYNIGILTLDFLASRTNMDKATRDAIVGVPRYGSLLSNLGLVDHLEGEHLKYKVEDVSFSQNSGGTIFTFAINIVSTRDNGSEFVVTMVDNDKISTDQFDAIVKRFKSSLKLEHSATR